MKELLGLAGVDHGSDTGPCKQPFCSLCKTYKSSGLCKGLAATFGEAVLCWREGAATVGSAACTCRTCATININDNRATL